MKRDILMYLIQLGWVHFKNYLYIKSELMVYWVPVYYSHQNNPSNKISWIFTPPPEDTITISQRREPRLSRTCYISSIVESECKSRSTSRDCALTFCAVRFLDWTIFQAGCFLQVLCVHPPLLPASDLASRTWDLLQRTPKGYWFALP